LIGFVVIYTVLLIVEMKLMLKAIRKGPQLDAQDIEELKTSPYTQPHQAVTV